MSKTLLLTGIGGSIGVHTFAHIMHNTDWNVIGIDSFRHKGLTDKVDEMLKTHTEWKDRLRLVTHDLCAPFSDLMVEKLGKVDYIIAMASLSDVEASIQDPVPFIRNNVEITTNLLEYARVAKPEVFVLFSTDEVYGAAKSKKDVYTEWSPIVPSNPYAASKACQEAIAISYWRTYNVPLIITNTMNNFGEMQQPSKYPVIVQKAIMNDKELTIHGNENGDIGSRSYIHSRNASDALIFLLKNCPPYMHTAGTADKPDRYNIAGDRQLDNLELAQLIAKLMGKELKYKLVNFHHTKPGHDHNYGLEDSKLKNLGWKSPVSFEESLKNTIDWQTNNPQWLK